MLAKLSNFCSLNLDNLSNFFHLCFLASMELRYSATRIDAATRSSLVQSMIEKLHHFNKHLRALHRRLLENERLAAEKELNQKLNPFVFLNMLMQDVRFGWLKPLSAFMTDLDVFLDDAKTLEPADVNRIKKEMTAILQEVKFAERYELHKNEDAEFAALHSQFTKAMDSL